MNRYTALLLFLLVFAAISQEAFATDKVEATKFQQYEQQSPQYGNPPGYMLPPVMYGFAPYGYGTNYAYNQDFVDKTNYNAYSYYNPGYGAIPYVWFNPVDFAGDEYNNAHRKYTSTLVPVNSYSTNQTQNTK